MSHQSRNAAPETKATVQNSNSGSSAGVSDTGGDIEAILTYISGAGFKGREIQHPKHTEGGLAAPETVKFTVLSAGTPLQQIT